MRNPALSVVPIYIGHRPGLLEFLAGRLSEIFERTVRVHPPWFDPETAFDATRGQYHSTRLLASLLTAPPAPEGTKILGIAGVDLFVPVLTYVFGEAELGGRAAVVSLHRLRPEAYGLPPDPSLLQERLLKTTVHELGHTLGLIHCPHPTCAMQPATYAEEIDLKAAAFCPACQEAAGRGVAGGVAPKAPHLRGLNLPPESAGRQLPAPSVE